MDEAGNFSIEVLRAALSNRYRLDLRNIREQGALDGKDVTDLEGFICNRDSHWFAIRKINRQYWDLNSAKERPEQITSFRLAAEIEGYQKSGYSVFCIVNQTLPPPCTTDEGRERGLPQYWRKEEDLVKGKSDATTGATDPWRNVGGGMRLDGNTSSSTVGSSLIGMSEDEMLQRALAASLDKDSNRKPSMKVEVKSEPAAAEVGCIRIQFRLPNGGRIVRRFLEDDSVRVVYAFVENQCPNDGKKLELRAGFPPADLATKEGDTIKDARLSGESIQCRHV